MAVLDPGDEAMAELSALVRAKGLSAAQVTAVGAFARATIGPHGRSSASPSSTSTQQRAPGT